MANLIGAEAFLAKHPAWTKEDSDRDAVMRSYAFADFKTAWAFMSACALRAEQLDHHPEWINVYAKVDVTLSTHDAGGETEKDSNLAAYMDDMAARLA